MTPGGVGEKHIGTALIVSDDAIATGLLTEAMQELALSVEVCIKTPAALDRIDHHKLEVALVDFGFGESSSVLVERIRASSSNRTAVVFAVTSSSTETGRALRAGANFALERPLTLESIRNTLKAAYGMIIRERRRYFRYPVSVPAVMSDRESPEIFGKTINVSESGLAFAAHNPIRPGIDVSVGFTLEQPPLSIQAECRVRWSNDKGEAGLSFLFLPAHTASLLQSWLAEKLEEQLPHTASKRFQNPMER